MPKILPDFLLVFGNVECFNFLVKNSFRSFFDRTDKSQNSKLFIQDFEVLRKLTHSKSPLPTKRVMKIATTHKKSYLRFRDNKSLPPFVFYSKMEYKQDINIAKLNFLQLDIQFFFLSPLELPKALFYHLLSLDTYFRYEYFP